MSLTEARILACADDDTLFKLLGEELTDRLGGPEDADLDLLLSKIRLLPVGLRAMVATYQLDVSMTLDDFGWHFANWHHRRYCEETVWALRELEAFEQAGLFAQAYVFAQPHWDAIGELLREDFQAFVDWYPDSPLEKATMPLTERMWELQKIDDGLFGYWTRYARKYPYKIAQMAS